LDDLGCSVVRVFDINPTKRWPITTNNTVLGARKELSRKTGVMIMRKVILKLQGSRTVQLDMSRSARVLNENRVKDNMLSTDYKSTPDVAMIRFDQERGEQLDKKNVNIPRMAKVQQVVPTPRRRREISTRMNRCQDEMVLI